MLACLEAMVQQDQDHGPDTDLMGFLQLPPPVEIDGPSPSAAWQHAQLKKLQEQALARLPPDVSDAAVDSESDTDLTAGPDTSDSDVELPPDVLSSEDFAISRHAPCAKSVAVLCTHTCALCTRGLCPRDMWHMCWLGLARAPAQAMQLPAGVRGAVLEIPA